MKPALLGLSALALIAATLPPEPATHPDWAQAADIAVMKVRSEMVDPDSLMIQWTSGFAWGYARLAGGNLMYGWVACAKYNARNRMGGYGGFTDMFVLVDQYGNVHGGPEQDGGLVFGSLVSHSSCRNRGYVPVNPELHDIDPSHPSVKSAAPDVAEEIAKLAALRDKGILTEQEFQAQKAKLLNH